MFLLIKIHLYDDKLTIIFNSGDNSVTINDLLLSEIEDNSKKAEGLFLDGVAPLVEDAYSERVRKARYIAV